MNDPRRHDEPIPLTEGINPNTAHIDRADTLHIVRMINEEDRAVPSAVERELPHIAAAVDAIVSAMDAGGRLFYVGAGTSGRLGVLDASECPPTFGTDPGLVIGLIAGGDGALRQAIEGAEDSPTLCERQLREHSFDKHDVLCGIAASGRTPYVLGGMRYAHELGATVISLTCAPNSPMAAAADISIAPVVGPEVIAGSTRMKAGTAQKLVLNMLTTATMIRRRRVFGNRMVDMQPTNAKLIARAERMVAEICGCSRAQAKATLASCSYHPKTAILMLLSGCDAATAANRLAAAHGHLSLALGNS
jgi:N-acetylmuramic acid 6-phosphate etherase